MTSTGASIALGNDPGTRRLFTVSILARLPLATFSIGVLVHAQHLTGSYAAAGVVSGALAIAQGLGGPVLGRLVDRSGQTATLTASALVAAGSLVALAIAPADSPLSLLVLLAAVLGFATPPGRRLPADPALRCRPGQDRSARRVHSRRRRHGTKGPLRI